MEMPPKPRENKRSPAARKFAPNKIPTYEEGRARAQGNLRAKARMGARGRRVSAMAPNTNLKPHEHRRLQAHRSLWTSENKEGLSGAFAHMIRTVNKSEK